MKSYGWAKSRTSLLESRIVMKVKISPKMSRQMMQEQTLIEKIRSLRPERVAEVEDFDVLSKLDFSLAFLVVSLTYIATLLFGCFPFNGPVNLCRVAGVLIICSGVFVVIISTFTPVGV
ncbi:MAG: hypothetical protein ABSF52_23615 [Syntrophobacteraceae bacterium]